MFNLIRRQFCKHDFEHVRAVTFSDCAVDTYLCKKCGWIRRIVT